MQVVKNLHLPRFTLEKFLTDYCNSKTNTGKRQSLGHAVSCRDPHSGGPLFTTDRHTHHATNPSTVSLSLSLSLSPLSLSCHSRLPSQTQTRARPTGEYSCLKVDLLFKREFSYYLIQIYIPCCMLVIVSWVSFWLDQGAVPARVSLGVTTLLTMATQTSGINASLPPVSYTKAIDVWTGVCLTFVFGALLEFALVNYASRSG